MKALPLKLIEMIENYRNGEVAVTGGVENTITFSKAMPHLSFMVMAQCVDSNGDEVTVGLLSAITVDGFKCTPAANGTLKYKVEPTTLFT